MKKRKQVTSLFEPWPEPSMFEPWPEPVILEPWPEPAMYEPFGIPLPASNPIEWPEPDNVKQENRRQVLMNLVMKLPAKSDTPNRWHNGLHIQERACYAGFMAIDWESGELVHESAYKEMKHLIESFILS